MLGIAAATALFLLGGRSEPPPAPPELIAIAADLDTKLKETAAGLKSRASTIADLPRLGAAVATDAATVEDLTQEELAFRLKPGETIEIAQVTKGGQAISLLRIPKDAQAAPPMVTPGSALSAAPGGLLASEVVNITPTVETGIHHGALAVSWFVDARPFLERIDVLGIPARIVLDGATVATAGGTMPADAPTVSVPLAGGRAGIVAAAPDASGGPVADAYLGPGGGRAVAALRRSAVAAAPGGGELVIAPTTRRRRRCRR
jgi:hypothetical protein